MADVLEFRRDDDVELDAPLSTARWVPPGPDNDDVSDWLLTDAVFTALGCPDDFLEIDEDCDGGGDD